MSIGNLSSAPDQAGLRSEHDAPDYGTCTSPFPTDSLTTPPAWSPPATSDDEHRRWSTRPTSDDDESSGAASTIVGLLPLLLIVVAVYFLLLRPRQRQMRQQTELQSSLEVGDEVMLTSGVYGFITGFEQGSDVVWVEIDDDVQIRVSRAAISGKVDDPGAATPAAAGERRRRR